MRSVERDRGIGFSRGDENRGKKRTRGGQGGVLHSMHGRSHDYRPSHPYNAGTEHVGFSPTRQRHLLAPGFAKRLEVFGESNEGWAACILLRTACQAELQWMTASKKGSWGWLFLCTAISHPLSPLYSRDPGTNKECVGRRQMDNYREITRYKEKMSAAKGIKMGDEGAPPPPPLSSFPYFIKPALRPFFLFRVESSLISDFAQKVILLSRKESEWRGEGRVGDLAHEKGKRRKECFLIFFVFFFF